MTRRFIQHLAAGSFILALAGCGAPPPPEVFPPLDYSYLHPIIFKVATLNIVDNDAPGGADSGLAYPNPAPPAATLLAMLNHRLQPSGQPGSGTVTIQAATITLANGNLNGQMIVDVSLTSGDGHSTATAEATVSASQSAPDSGADQNDVEAAQYQLTKRLMDLMNVQLPYQIQHSLSNWVVWSGAPGAVNMAPGAAPGVIQAAPLAAPGTPPALSTGAMPPPAAATPLPPGAPMPGTLGTMPVPAPQ